LRRGRLGFGYVIRFHGNVHVTAADGQTRLAADWAGKAGGARRLRGAALTADHKVDAAASPDAACREIRRLPN
jgi:hypothetical protein